jgi:hypothetical protein
MSCIEESDNRSTIVGNLRKQDKKNLGDNYDECVIDFCGGSVVVDLQYVSVDVFPEVPINNLIANEVTTNVLPNQGRRVTYQDIIRNQDLISKGLSVLSLTW